MNSNQAALLVFVCLSLSASLRAADASTNAAPVAPVKILPLVTTVSDVSALPVVVAATDPKIRYLGRFDSSKGDPRCSWTDSAVLLKFQGTDLNAQLEDSGCAYWEIEIDGKPVQKMALGTGSHLYTLASKALIPGPHTVRLVRASEASFGPTQIHGFQLNQGGTLLPVALPIHRLEVIGDSITCGALNEGQPGVKNPQNVDENGYLSYPGMTARQLGLDYRCVSWSGRKMWPNKTIPSIYDLTIPTEKDLKWDFSKWSPEAILINLSTNDFNRDPVDEAAWTGAYEKFVKLLRGYFPKADIYCATSPMLTGARLATSKTYLAKIASDLNAAGDAKVHYFEFDTENPVDGIGGSRHPNVKTDQIMGNKLAAQLTKDLGWSAVANR